MTLTLSGEITPEVALTLQKLGEALRPGIVTPSSNDHCYVADLEVACTNITADLALAEQRIEELAEELAKAKKAKPAKPTKTESVPVATTETSTDAPDAPAPPAPPAEDQKAEEKKYSLEDARAATEWFGENKKLDIAREVIAPLCGTTPEDARVTKIPKEKFGEAIQLLNAKKEELSAK